MTASTKKKPIGFDIKTWIFIVALVAACGGYYARTQMVMAQVDDLEGRMRRIEESIYRMDENIQAIREDIRDIKEDLRDGRH